MGGFVSGVAALPRIVTVEEVDIRPMGKKDQLRMAALAKTYRYLDENELAAAAPKPKAGRRK